MVRVQKKQKKTLKLETQLCVFSVNLFFTLQLSAVYTLPGSCFVGCGTTSRHLGTLLKMGVGDLYAELAWGVCSMV